MRKYKTVLKKEKEVTKTFCDLCGKGNRKDGFFPGGSGEISFGYGSTKHDGAVFRLDICDDCFDKRIAKHVEMVSNWIYPPGVAKFNKARRKTAKTVI